MNVQKVALLVVALAVASQACAQTRSRPTFESLDADSDGKLSATELSESPAARRVSPEQMLKKLDTDGDGFVSKQEFDQLASRKKT